MKKVLYSLLAISMAALSCTKESDINNNDNNQNEVVPGVVSEAIPATITGVLSEKTKTAYTDNGDFTWVDSDQVRLIVTKDLNTYSPQGYYTYTIKSLSSDNKTATFTSTGDAGDLTDFDNSGDYKSTGYAVYPISVLDRFSTPEGHSYGAPWFTLAKGSVSGAMSDIILIGVNDASISNFKFYTAMSVLKVTLKNIPANAAAIKLCTSDKTNYPIDGDFAISTGSDGKPALTFLTTYASSFKGYQKVDVSEEGEISESSYYFNIPAATYPANTLSIVVEDANGGQILKRTINAAITLERNDCLSMPSISYSYSISITGNANAPRLAWTIDCKRIRFHVSQDSTNDINNYESGYTFANDNSTGSYSSTYDMSKFANNKPTDTGQYYLHYLLQSDRGDKPTSMSDANVVGYGTIPFYFLGSDASSFAKQYTFTSTDSGDSQNFWHPGTGSNYTKTMTLSASNDVTKGNLMMSELYGKTAANKPLYGILTSAGATSITFAYNGDGENDYFFQQGNYFHVAQSSNGWASYSTSDVVFSIASGPVLTSQAYLMMKFTASYPANWGQFVYGYQLEFN